MQRYLNILEFSLQSLARRRARHLAVTGVYALVVAFFASVVFFTTSLREETRQMTRELPELWVQQLQGGRLVPFADSLVQHTEKLRGVRHIYKRYWGYFFDDATGAVLTVLALDSARTFPAALPAKLPAPGQVYMGEGLLNLRNLRVGDFLSVSDAEGEKIQLEIVGSFGAESELLTQDLLLVAPKTAQKMLGLRSNECTDLAVEVWNPDEVSNLGRKIDEALPAARVVQRSQLQATYDALFSWRGGIFLYGGMLSLFAFLLLAWQHAVGLSGPERRELGILKGLGWEVRDVLLHKLNESAAVAVSATLLGLLLAWVHVFVLQSPLLKPFLVGWSVLYPSYNFLPIIQAGDLLAIALLAIVPYLTAAIIPAWRGSITDPSEIMRG